MPENIKEQYPLQRHETLFERRGLKIPASEEEFRAQYLDEANTAFPRYFVVQALESKGIDIDSYESSIDEKVLNDFLDLYEIIYPDKPENSEPVREPEPEVRPEPKPASRKAEEAKSDECVFSIESAARFLSECSCTPIFDEESVSAVSVEITDGLDITINNQLIVRTRGIDIVKNAAVIMDADESEVCGVGKIEVNEAGEMFFTAKAKDILFDRFEDCSDFRLYAFTEVPDPNLGELYTGSIYSCELQADWHELEVKENLCLCIDFGTSNTTAGCSGLKADNDDTIRLVQFVNTRNGNELTPICPTVVYVLDCRDKDNIIYLFGYDAQKRLADKQYDSKASFYYEIKHWVGMNDDIKIYDEGNHHVVIKRDKIVKAYIDYIIDCAHLSFGCEFSELHFTAPVKIKSKFVREMEKFYSGKYRVWDADKSIDEAVAVIYDYVFSKADEIAARDIQDGENSEIKRENKMVVFDCGGGTTDLAVCEYSFQKTHSSHVVEVSTRFENGRSDFGGNNITLKIFQLLKIKIAKSMGFISSREYNELFSVSERDILRSVDMPDSDEQSFNSRFDELYLKCEELIPTQFESETKKFSPPDKRKIKRNFFYLWQYAEKVKLEFYMTEEKVRVQFAESDKLDIDSIEDSEYLYICSDGIFKKLDAPLTGIEEVTITEIRKIICEDIYSALINVLPEEPDKFDHYRMSGQSCKINLFNELMKEFIAGRKLREMLGSDRSETNVALKMKCISGSIRYIYHKKHNIFKLAAKREQPKINYSVFITTMGGKTVDVFGTDKDDKIILYNVELKGENEIDKQRFFDFRIRDKKTGKEVKSGSHAMNAMSEMKSGNIDQLREMFRKTTFIDCDRVINKLMAYKENVYCIVALPERDGYGFVIQQLGKTISGGEAKYYWIPNAASYSFEENYRCFFDGKR